MNERIKELAEQANLITHKVPNGLAHLHTEQDVEKFAEMIVKECIELSGDAGVYCQSVFEDLVKEHFGVEQ